MGSWGPGLHGNHVNTQMEIVQVPACADHGCVTTLSHDVVDMTVMEPG